jgi:division protein CdvB (Snf7/Vps24/ESCRT-III family)
MMQAMKGATQALGSMNKSMNLPALRRIAMEFERENDIMEQRQEIMDDVMDDAMDVGVEEEGDEVVEQVLEEIGVDLNQAVSPQYSFTRLVNWRHILMHRANSLEKHQQAFRQTRSPKEELLRLLVAAAAEEEEVRRTLAMTISKHDWTAYGSSKPLAGVSPGAPLSYVED